MSQDASTQQQLRATNLSKQGYANDSSSQDPQDILDAYCNSTSKYKRAVRDYSLARHDRTRPEWGTVSLDPMVEKVELYRKAANQARIPLKAEMDKLQALSSHLHNDNQNPPSYDQDCFASLLNYGRRKFPDCVETELQEEWSVSREWAAINGWKIWTTATGYEIGPLPSKSKGESGQASTLQKPKTRKIHRVWNQYENRAAASKNSGKDLRFRALFDFETAEEGDLLFARDQIIDVVDAIDDNWLEGCYTDSTGSLRTGIFPITFVEKCPPKIPTRPKKSAYPS